MANIMDYLDWRGDLLFSERPFTEPDNLLLAELSYLDFGGIVDPHPDGNGIPLCEAMERYRDMHPTTDMGVLVPGVIPEMASKMASSRRFGDVIVDGYLNEIDIETQMQFSAVSFLLPDGTVYVAFRGTDDTIVGWREDFNMAFLTEVPAQKYAAEYLKMAAAGYPGCSLRIGGHSKGGNLAVYAAVFCGDEVQDRILQVFCNDGPGFKESLLSLPEHERIQDRIITILPDTSIVGMLLFHEERRKVVKSCESGLRQHDGFSWQVKGSSFEEVSDFSAEGKFIDRTLDSFVAGMNDVERLSFINSLFDILACTDGGTLTDLKNGGFKTAAAMMKAMTGMPTEQKHTLIACAKLLLSSGAKTAGADLKSGAETKKEALEALLQHLLAKDNKQ